jgi:DnaJ-class molecular chaperone
MLTFVIFPSNTAEHLALMKRSKVSFDGSDMSLKLALINLATCHFSVVSKSFTILSDKNMRAVYDSNPKADPSSRGGGGGGAGMARGFGRGGMNGQRYQAEMDPAELFNMFFGGGGFGGGGGQPSESTSPNGTIRSWTNVE